MRTIILILLLAVAPVSHARDEMFNYLLTADNTTSLSVSDNSDLDKISSLTIEQAAKKDCSNLGYSITLFTPCGDEDGKRLWRQTKIMMLGGVGVAGIIALLPSSISKWDGEDTSSGDVLNKWWSNVNDGPVWDEDEWYINIIGHTYFGGVYYIVSRKSGYNQWNSFVYTALMSTFYWEYGLEAFAEVPSIQDLIITPVGGWVYGEWAYHKEKQIRRNGNLAMGSKFLGSLALFALDPIGVVDSWCCASKKVEVTAFNIARWPVQRNSSDIRPVQDYWGIEFAVQF